MATYLLTGKAQQDLADIAEYTKEHWGRSQARIYFNEIESGCEQIAGKPGIGKSREDLSIKRPYELSSRKPRSLLPVPKSTSNRRQSASQANATQQTYRNWHQLALFTPHNAIVCYINTVEIQSPNLKFQQD